MTSLELIHFFHTIYIFNPKLCGTLKELPDGNLKIIDFCNIEIDTLKDFLTKKGYVIQE